MEDKRLRVKGREEIAYESYEHRTVVVTGLPAHYRMKKITEIFSSYGAIVAVELPTKNLLLEELQPKKDAFT